MGQVHKIAISGGDFAGKDTMLDYIKHLYKPLSFSDGLKKIANDIFPWCNLDYLPEEKENKVIYTNPETGVEYTPRMVWEVLDCLPQVDPDVFIRPLKDMESEYMRNNVSRMCIKDIRRPRELQYCVDRGYHIVYIDTDDERWLHKVQTDNRTIIQFRHKAVRNAAHTSYFNSKSDRNWRTNFASFICQLLYNLGDQRLSKEIHENHVM